MKNTKNKILVAAAIIILLTLGSNIVFNIVSMNVNPAESINNLYTEDAAIIENDEDDVSLVDPIDNNEEIITEIINEPSVEYVENELVLAVDTIEEAELFAETYDVELTTFSYGVATYACEDPELIIEEVKESDDELSQDLSLNRKYELYEAEYTTIDALATQINYDFSYQYYLDELGIDDAWEISTGENVVVAVIDTGIDIDHDEFEGIISEYSYNAYTDEVGIEAVDDDNGHGTHVSGIIAASVDNENNIYGIAPNVELLVIKINSSSDGDITLSSLLRAINYAVEQDVDIINMSLGSSYSGGSYASEEAAIQSAAEAGITVICAAGNESSEHANYPAAYESTIAVSAVKEGFEFDNSYSNYGPEIDIAAQGTNIYSTYTNNQYATGTGTSMASPVVTAVAALIKSIHPEYTSEELENALYSAAQDAGDLGWDEYYGYGVLNAYAAVIDEDEMYTITYDYNDGSETTYESNVAPGQAIIEPNDPTGNTEFLGWSIEESSDNYFDFDSEPTKNITLYAQWTKGGSVSGEITSYNPQTDITITLTQDNEVVDTLIIEKEDGSGEYTESFIFENLAVGTYSIQVNKEYHTSYTINEITVFDEDDETNINETQYITLLCGDINSDGLINQSDLNEIWDPDNYNSLTSNSSNEGCDLNGDGFINQTDLNILWSPINYNQGSVIISLKVED